VRNPAVADASQIPDPLIPSDPAYGERGHGPFGFEGPARHRKTTGSTAFTGALGHPDGQR